MERWKIRQENMVAASEVYGLAVESYGTKHCFRDHEPFCHDDMRRTMMAMTMESQQKSFDDVGNTNTQAIAGHAEVAAVP